MEDTPVLRGIEPADPSVVMPPRSRVASDEESTWVWIAAGVGLLAADRLLRSKQRKRSDRDPLEEWLDEYTDRRGVTVAASPPSSSWLPETVDTAIASLFADDDLVPTRS